MLVVIGIIILFITMAIPAISAITGTRSISAAENQISAVLARAREEAIGIQDYRGILFYLDPREDRVVAAIVRPADFQGNSTTNPTSAILLDAVANRDYLMLPQGVRLQTLYDDPAERYLGFNPTPGSSENVRFGGVVLFDGQGRLVSKAYGFQFVAPDPANAGGNVPSGMSAVLKTTGAPFIPIKNNNILRSQMGLVLFDLATFKAQVFATDGDPGLDSAVVLPPNEQSEENWLDGNSTPILINRFNGTLIRGE